MLPISTSLLNYKKLHIPRRVSIFARSSPSSKSSSVSTSSHSSELVSEADTILTSTPIPSTEVPVIKQNPDSETEVTDWYSYLLQPRSDIYGCINTKSDQGSETGSAMAKDASNELSATSAKATTIARKPAKPKPPVTVQTANKKRKAADDVETTEKERKSQGCKKAKTETTSTKPVGIRK